MKMHENPHISFFLKVGYLICGIAAIILFFKIAFPWTVPLVIALIMSNIVEKPVKFLVRKGVHRNLASGVCTLLYLTLFGVIIYLLVSTAVTQGRNLVTELPGLLESLPDKIESTGNQFDNWFKLLPLDRLGIDIKNFSELLANIKLPSIDPSVIVKPLFAAAMSFPTFLISIVFMFVATFFLVSERKNIYGFVRRQLSPKVLGVVDEMVGFLSGSVFGWVRAQLILITITFTVLIVGFTVMKLPYALVLAMLIAVIDALPILGVGTVLLPWGLFALISGDPMMAVSLCIIYAVVLVVRNTLEPKILGVQIGLHPFVTLLCIYFGFRIAGFGGMFLLPVFVIMMNKLQDMGVLKWHK